MPHHHATLPGRMHCIRHAQLLGLILTLLLLAGGTAWAQTTSTKAKTEFFFGADISWVQQREAQGTKYSDGGETKDIIQILKDHKFNSIRLRIFNDPKRSRGAGDAGGYSPGVGYCDLEHTLAMAKRVKAAGMMFVLDFHYSDNWADPGKQVKPAAWKDLHGADLEKAIHDYTRDTLLKFKAQGTSPEMVQIGNEISSGMLRPDGAMTGGNWAPLCGLLKAGIAGAREADPNVKTILHLAMGGQMDKTRNFLDHVTAGGVKFDIIGQSYYPEFHGTLADLKNNMADMAARYKLPIMVMEYSAVPDRKGPQDVRAIHDIVHAAPGGLGIGAYIWEPTARGLFDRTGKTLPAIDLYPKMAEDYANGK